MSKLAAIALFPVLVVGGAVVNTSVLLVDVDTPEGPDVTVPVPLPVARAGLWFAPEQARRVKAPELAEHLPRVRKIVKALEDAPDGVFVEVRDRDEYVEIIKEDDDLRVHVIDGSRTTVDVRFPLAAAQKALDAYDRDERTFDTSELVAALGSAPRGELVHVLDGKDEVRISMW